MLSELKFRYYVVVKVEVLVLSPCIYSCESSGNKSFNICLLHMKGFLNRTIDCEHYSDEKCHKQTSLSLDLC